MPYFGVYRATVTDTDDPQSQGRIQVKVPAVSAAAQWAAVCLPCVADESAIQPPEAGNTVWVAFEGGDARRPIYLGILPA